MVKEINQCKDCKYGHNLRIHILTGVRNCFGGRKGSEKYHAHPANGVCKDFVKEKKKVK